MKQKFLILLLHITGWALLLLLPTVFSFKKAVRFDELWTRPHEIQNLISWVLLIGFTYLNHLWLVPELYLKKRNWRYVASLGLGLILLFGIPQIFGMVWSQPPVLPAGPNGIVPPKPALILEFSHIVLLFIVAVLVSIAYHTQLRLQHIEQQRLQTELAQLKAQIQPHFLFNTLNSIYALAIRKDDKTAETVVQLSAFLRYVIRETDEHEVPLVKEIDYIRNYIDLQRSRLRDSIQLDFRVEGEWDSLKIAPLLLFGFIENAFKHGVSPEEESIIDISIAIEPQFLKLDVYNKKVEIEAPPDSDGIGLTNARKRLQLLYPGKHHLKIEDTANDFRVILTLTME